MQLFLENVLFGWLVAWLVGFCLFVLLFSVVVVVFWRGSPKIFTIQMNLNFRHFLLKLD